MYDRTYVEIQIKYSWLKERENHEEQFTEYSRRLSLCSVLPENMNFYYQFTLQLF